MLVLSRRVSEQIVVNGKNENIVITVVRIGDRVVRIGIDAPRDFRIDRREVFDAIRDEAMKFGAVSHDGGPDKADGAPSNGRVR